MFSLRSVCLSVCFSVCLITENVGKDFGKISWRGRAWPRDQWDKFWWRFGSPSRSRSPKSEIQIHWIIEKVPSGLSCTNNLHCKNHSAILLCWRSAEVCALWVLLVIIKMTIPRLLNKCLMSEMVQACGKWYSWTTRSAVNDVSESVCLCDLRLSSTESISWHEALTAETHNKQLL